MTFTHHHWGAPPEISQLLRHFFRLGSPVSRERLSVPENGDQNDGRPGRPGRMEENLHQLMIKSMFIPLQSHDFASVS